MTATAHRPSALHRLRRWSAWVLAWFTVTLAVGALAPSMDPRGLAALCSAASTTLAGWNADGAGQPDDGLPTPMGAHAGVCPLCATPATLPPVAVAPVAPMAVVARRPLLIADTRQPASQTTRPAFARGPPHQAEA